jgi:hypothetical protein
MDAATSLALDAAVAAGQASTSYMRSSVRYDVDLAGLRQKNTKTGFVRSIRKAPAGTARAVVAAARAAATVVCWGVVVVVVTHIPDVADCAACREDLLRCY